LLTLNAPLGSRLTANFADAFVDQPSPLFRQRSTGVGLRRRSPPAYLNVHAQ
jgi:hypothetical protein